MRKYIAIITLVMAAGSLWAQNDNADNIVGVYYAQDEGDNFRMRVTKEEDGTYKGQIIWVEKKYGRDGQLLRDTNNPDKSLRNVPCDQIVLFKGLKYDSGKQRWGGTKVYHPKMGIKANLSVRFKDHTHMIMTGSLLGISQTRDFLKEE
ncbi:MAG: DUF2147 domain-containing protein [Bacteroidales bacterium]|nr:DUF2147 domain-containing protein [Bacteroidales bacterium]